MCEIPAMIFVGSYFQGHAEIFQFFWRRKSARCVLLYRTSSSLCVYTLSSKANKQVKKTVYDKININAKEYHKRSKSVRCFLRMIKWDEILISGSFPLYTYNTNTAYTFIIVCGMSTKHTLDNNSKCTASYTVCIIHVLPATIISKLNITLYLSQQIVIYKTRIIMQIIFKYRNHLLSDCCWVVYILTNYYGNSCNMSGAVEL